MWRRHRSRRRLCIAATLAGLALGAKAARAEPLWTEISGGPAPRRAESLPDFVDLAARLSPAVVNVSTEDKSLPKVSDSPDGDGGGPGDRFAQPFENEDPAHPQSLGSGFIINKDGFILTNEHVVEDGQRIQVTLQDGREFKARVIGRDDKTDIALLKIDAAGQLPIAPLGDSDSLRVGAWVIAIGNPFGFDHSVTAGIVSAKGRFIPGNYDEYIQTDASINPGNSGGPLIDQRGAVVAVNSAIYTRTGANMGIGFAIPVNIVKEELSQLRASGKVVRGWLGVYIQKMTPEIAESLGLPSPSGALVAEVLKGGPAKSAGIERGDVITAFDGTPIVDSRELPLLVGRTPIGHVATLKLMRQGKAQELKIAITQSHEEEVASAQPIE